MKQEVGHTLQEHHVELPNISWQATEDDILFFELWKIKVSCGKQTRGRNHNRWSSSHRTHSWIKDLCPLEGALVNCYATLTVLATVLAIVVANTSGPGKEDMIR